MKICPPAVFCGVLCWHFFSSIPNWRPSWMQIEYVRCQKCLLVLLLWIVSLMLCTNVDRVLGSVRAPMCALDPCSSWLLETSQERVLLPLVKSIISSLIKEALPRPLKEAIIIPLLKKSSLKKNKVASYRQSPIYLFQGRWYSMRWQSSSRIFWMTHLPLIYFGLGSRSGLGPETALIALIFF